MYNKNAPHRHPAQNPMVWTAGPVVHAALPALPPRPQEQALAYIAQRAARPDIRLKAPTVAAAALAATVPGATNSHPAASTVPRLAAAAAAGVAAAATATTAPPPQQPAPPSTNQPLRPVAPASPGRGCGCLPTPHPAGLMVASSVLGLLGRGLGVPPVGVPVGGPVVRLVVHAGDGAAWRGRRQSRACRVSVSVCVHVCVRAYVRACVRACGAVM